MDNHGVWSEETSTSLSIHERPTAGITHIEPGAVYPGETVHFTGFGNDDGEIVAYAWRSSKDGEFYNGTKSRTESSEFSVGEHIIYFKVKDNYGAWSKEVSASLTIRSLPKAHIEYISPNPANKGAKIGFSGRGDDGTTTITRYAWRSSIDGEFYNGTRSSFDNSGLSAGEHTIFLKVKDNNGVWSPEVETTLTVTSSEEKDKDDSSDFMKLVLYLGLGGVLFFVMVFLFISKSSKNKADPLEDEEEDWEDEDEGDYQDNEPFVPEEGHQPMDQSQEVSEEEDDDDFLPPMEDDEDFAPPLDQDDDDDDDIIAPLAE